jgi:hypothetical protein
VPNTIPTNKGGAENNGYTVIKSYSEENDERLSLPLGVFCISESNYSTIQFTLYRLLSIFLLLRYAIGTLNLNKKPHLL